MSKFVELIDTGVKIATRFHSHCPQTGRKFYHPPASSDDNSHHHPLLDLCNYSYDGASGGSSDMSSQMRYYCGPAAVLGVETPEFTIYYG
ncbi:hypothetical protein CJ030_MR0G007842 [Morella rubra]|uniref:Uncharacterized protein n=1 Tax=Morella rubra TaxID=262757 RepID=A0A6A1UIY6_9ROSI|nr:hypothetical protein CJ030_MR0G007842 [Morella rubra]